MRESQNVKLQVTEAYLHSISVHNSPRVGCDSHIEPVCLTSSRKFAAGSALSTMMREVCLTYFKYFGQHQSSVCSAVHRNLSESHVV
jgi:hypothetical protein